MNPFWVVTEDGTVMAQSTERSEAEAVYRELLAEDHGLLQLVQVVREDGATS